MDAVTSLSHGRLGLTLERLLQVDVDDMFVGKPGIRTTLRDADVSIRIYYNLYLSHLDHTFKVGCKNTYIECVSSVFFTVK